MRPPIEHPTTCAGFRCSSSMRDAMSFTGDELARGVGVRHHADTRIEPRAILPEEAAPQGDRELTIAASVDPSHRARVPTAFHSLELVDEPVSGRSGPATYRGGGVQGGGQRQ